MSLQQQGHEAFWSDEMGGVGGGLSNMCYDHVSFIVSVHFQAKVVVSVAM